MTEIKKALMLYVSLTNMEGITENIINSIVYGIEYRTSKSSFWDFDIIKPIIKNKI